MRLLRVGAAVLDQTPLDWEGNVARIDACLAAARARGVALLCLPELCITGYGCEDAFLAPGVHAAALASLHDLLPATRGMVVSLGLPLSFRNKVLNAACVVADGRILGFEIKRHLAGDGIHYEPRWFEPWPDGRHAEIEIHGARHPLGDLRFDVGGVKIGFEICEDAWIARRPGGDLARRGVDVILNPSASHFAFDKHAVRERLVLEGSRAFGVAYVYANLLGNEAGRILYDGDALIASGGRMIARGPRLGFADHHVTVAEVDLDENRLAQARTVSFQPDLAAPEDDCVRSAFALPEAEPSPVQVALPAWEASAHGKEEEFTRAVALGLFDYLRKSRSQGFVVSLSGGADSAAVASLCALMVDLATAELGLERFKTALSHVRGLEAARTPAEIVRHLLTCVYQGTRNSSATTREAARAVAQALGATFVGLDVDPLVAGYTGLVERAIGRTLDWEHDDFALQNIQARVRAPGAWMIANLRDALLLATSNRSEAAVGYTTMDGDTAGGISPIAGIDKAFLRRFLRWLEEEGPAGLHPIPALGAVNCQQPTAELRPLERAQTDETDLMPYDVLDAIERAAIRDKEMPLDVYRRLRGRFPDVAAATLVAWIERFFRLWSRNQWKRERYAPSFHLDDENLDPKTWCRFPILSGGFARELAALRAHLTED